MKIPLLYICLFLSSCAPMPGNILYEGLARETKLTEIKDYQIIIDPVKTTIECNRLMFKYDQYGVIALNLIGMGGFFVACTDLHADEETRLMDRCIIYSSFDMDFIIEHEKRHCMGYQDQLY